MDLYVFSQKTTGHFPKKKIWRGWIVGPIFLNKKFPYPTTQVLVFRDRCVFRKQHLGHAEKSPKSPGSRPKDSPAGALEKMLHVTEAGIPNAFPGDTKIGIPPEPPPGDFFFGGRRRGQRGPTKWAVNEFFLIFCLVSVWWWFFPSYVLCTDLWWRHKWSSRMVAGPVGYCAQLLLQAAKGESQKALCFFSALPLHCRDRNIWWFRWIKCWLNFEWPSFRPYTIMDENSWKLQTTKLDTSGDFLRLPSVFHVGMWFVGLPLVQEHQELSDQSKAALEERADLVARIEQEIFFGVKSTKMPGF